jgi:uncharacterized protein
MLRVRAFLLSTGMSCLLLSGFGQVAAGQGQAASQATAPSVGSLQGSHATDLAAAQQGDPAAQLRLGKAFNQGVVVNATKVVRRNYGQALQWFSAAAGQGSEEAKAWLGSLYLLGHGVGQDVGQAKALIGEAAASGDAVGLRFMGLMYETGQGVERDYRQAIAFYQRAVAAKDGNANDRLGILYLRGLGAKRNPGKAFEMFKAGAEMGDEWAELNLGQMYYGGHLPSGMAAGEASSETASAGLGSRNEGSNRGGNGRDAAARTTPDYASAVKYFGQSAAQGNRVAAYRLGQMYESGTGVSQDSAQALQFFEESASRRYGPALVAVGEANEMGRGTGVNLTLAYIAYSLALETNEGRAPELLQNLVRRLDAGQLQAAQAGLEAYKRQAAQAGSSQ